MDNSDSIGSAVLVSIYEETMHLPAIPDIIRLKYLKIHLLRYLQHILFQLLLWFQSVAGKLSDVNGRKKIVIIIMVVYIIGITVGGCSTKALSKSTGLKNIKRYIIKLDAGYLREK